MINADFGNHGEIADLTARVTATEAAVAAAPITPNLMADAKYWSSMCGGDVNVSKEIIAGHSDSHFSASWYSAAGTGTVEVVSLDKLATKGIPLGGDLTKACNSTFAGADFHVLLFDVTITSSTGGYGLYVINQGSSKFTGWNKGEFTTQSACFVNVIAQSGAIAFFPHHNMPAEIDVTSADTGKGWLYKHNTRTGWGGFHQPYFTGLGHMKLALALPYIGFGDHKGKFVFANSVGRYSHGGDYIPAGHNY